jgi:hypothetical protein
VFRFVSNTSLTMSHNVCIAFMNLPVWLYILQPQNKAFHNYTGINLPISVRSLLGLGLKYIPSPQCNKGHSDVDLQRFQRNMSLFYHFAGNSDNKDLNNELKPKSTWMPDNISAEYSVR